MSTARWRFSECDDELPAALRIPMQAVAPFVRWILVGALSLGGLVACEASSGNAAGVGGADRPEGGGGSVVAAGGADGGAGGGTGGSGGAAVCGNGLIEQPETCDGDELGGRTCADFGLNPGLLQCNASCQLVVSGCGLPESCNNGLDDDADGEVDCFDDECIAAPTCADSCAAPLTVVLPTFDVKSTIGRPSLIAPSCSLGSSSELIYRVTPAFSGTLGVTVGQWGGNFSITVAESCGGVELACASGVASPFFNESLQVAVVAGTPYFVMIDAASDSESGDFDVRMRQVDAGESACGDLQDNDFDGRLDCDDPDCQANPTCTGGTQPLGGACSQTASCSSTNGDPICLPSGLGFSGGYCSERCDLTNGDCPGDAVCYDFGLGVHGVCLDGCAGAGDCRSGYACRDLGLSSTVCHPPPETSCQNYADDDVDGLTDCDDPDCKGTVTCIPGGGDYGSPCTDNQDCQSALGGDPLCLRSPPFFFSAGYCSEFCSTAASDCGPDGLCFDWFYLDGTRGQCFRRCANDEDCDAGHCVNYGFGKHCNL